MTDAPRIVPLALPTPFPVGPANAYFLPGGVPTLVDCGPNSEDALAALDAGLRQAGARLADLRQLVVTHAHLDHFGLVARLRDAAPGLRVLAHPAAVPWLEDFGREWAERTEGQRRFGRAMGLDDAAVDVLVSVGRWLEQFGASAPVDAPVDEGDEVLAGDGRWQVLHTPGHSPSDIGLLGPGGAYLGGDTLLRDISSNALVEPPPAGRPRARSLLAYLASLRRLSKEPVTTVYPGHGPAFDGHAALIRRRIRMHRARRLKLWRMVAGRREARPVDLALELFPGIRPSQVYLALSEVLGHLDWLEADGRVAQEIRAGVTWYRAAVQPPAPGEGRRRKAASLGADQIT